MSKLIQKAGFLNPKRAGRYMNYIATRDGVELLDENADSIYMRYIATRPRAEKHGEHGLFGAEDAVDLEKTLGEVEKRFGRFLPHIKWLNMGGGHLMTRKDYDTEHLIGLLQAFKAKYPNLEIIMEPGSAFAWQTGFLLTTVVDIVENHGIKTAIIDASFTCHMPDCLEMPYKPVIRGAIEPEEGKPVYRIGGNSCLSGDYMGDWFFEQPLKVGDKLIFEDMIHYTIVKTTMFNGVTHPSIGIWNPETGFRLVRKFGYEDYKNRMS